MYCDFVTDRVEAKTIRELGVGWEWNCRNLKGKPSEGGKVQLE